MIINGCESTSGDVSSIKDNLCLPTSGRQRDWHSKKKIHRTDLRHRSDLGDQPQILPEFMHSIVHHRLWPFVDACAP